MNPKNVQTRVNYVPEQLDEKPQQRDPLGPPPNPLKGV
jgi:hypothetical protein